MVDVIEATGLVKTYGSLRALDGLDLAVPEGTVLGLLGPNGAGKTTAVRILTTLLPPDGGSARVAGADVVREPSQVRQRIGLSGQYAAVDEYLTGYENLDMVGRLYGLGRQRSRERARELLERFALADAADRPVKTYSGGMRRRLDLAGALVAQPPVLFLDEPTTGLDPRSRIDMWAVITELVGGGTTLLLTTQYLEEADRLADDIVVIDHGKAIARGTADQLKAQVGGERIELVLAEGGRPRRGARVPTRRAVRGPGRGRRRPAHAGRAGRRAGPGCSWMRCAGWTTPGIAVSDVALRRPTLDDVFLTLTGRPSDEAEPRRRPRRRRPRPTKGGRAMSCTKPLVDGAIVAKRNLIKIKRVPDLLVFSTLSPIMFILLFAYVFGSAIPIPGGGNYKEFLIPGIFAQTVIFGATLTGAGLADDIQKGIIDRFRSLPMSRSAVLVGRTGSDVANNVLVVFVMSVTGLIVGWRIRTDVAHAAAGFAAAAGLRLRHLLDHGVGRAAGAEPRGRQQRLVHRHLPADVHRQHVRAHQQLPIGAEGHRELEPGVVGDAGRARPVRQHQPERPGRRLLVAAAPGRLHTALDRGSAAGVRAAVGPAVPPRRQPLTGSRPGAGAGRVVTPPGRGAG